MWIIERRKSHNAPKCIMQLGEYCYTPAFPPDVQIRVFDVDHDAEDGPSASVTFKRPLKRIDVEEYAEGIVLTIDTGNTKIELDFEDGNLHTILNALEGALRED